MLRKRSLRAPTRNLMEMLNQYRVGARYDVVQDDVARHDGRGEIPDQVRDDVMRDSGSSPE